MTKIRLAVATADDAARLLEIYRPYVLTTAITFEYEVPTLEEFRARIVSTLEKYPYLVAKLDDKIVGYAYTSAFKSRAAYQWAVETSIYIDLDYKGGGIGSMLYHKLEEITKQQNIINLNACITAGNPESIVFHEHFGYQKVAYFTKCGYKFNQWHDMIWMEKMLGEHPGKPAPVIPFGKLYKHLSIIKITMEVVEMGLFGKKKKTVDLQQVFKDKYKDINQIVNDANNELDLEIQISLLELAYDKYNDLLDLIDQGVDFDKAHFLSMQQDLKKQIDLLKGL